MKKILIVFLIIITFSGCSIKKTNELTDAEKFSHEYKVSLKNPFKYTSLNNIYNIINKGNGIIFIGKADSDFCNQNVKILLDITKDKKIDCIYYYNPTKILLNNKKEVNKLLDKLDVDKKNELLGTYFIKDGKLIGSNNSILEYFEDEEYLSNVKDKYIKLLDIYNK